MKKYKFILTCLFLAGIALFTECLEKKVSHPLRLYITPYAKNVWYDTLYISYRGDSMVIDTLKAPGSIPVINTDTALKHSYPWLWAGRNTSGDSNWYIDFPTQKNVDVEARVGWFDSTILYDNQIFRK